MSVFLSGKTALVRAALDRQEWQQLPDSSFSQWKVTSNQPCGLNSSAPFSQRQKGESVLPGLLSWARLPSFKEKGDSPRKEPQWPCGDSCKFLWVRSPREQVSLSLGLPGYSFTSPLGMAGFLPSAFTLRPGARLHNFSPGLFETRHLVTVRCSGHWKGKEPAYLGLNLVSNLANPRFPHL